MVTKYANFEVSHPVLNRTCNITTTSFTFPENNQASCEMFQFSVTASNPAGDSVPTIIQDTIPICEFEEGPWTKGYDTDACSLSNLCLTQTKPCS